MAKTAICISHLNIGTPFEHQAIFCQNSEYCTTFGIQSGIQISTIFLYVMPTKSSGDMLQANFNVLYNNTFQST